MIKRTLPKGPPLDLVHAQFSAIASLLDGSALQSDVEDLEAAGLDQSPWKVLVFDDFTQHLLSTVVKVGRPIL